MTARARMVRSETLRQGLSTPGETRARRSHSFRPGRTLLGVSAAPPVRSPGPGTYSRTRRRNGSRLLPDVGYAGYQAQRHLEEEISFIVRTSSAASERSVMPLPLVRSEELSGET